MPSNVHFSQQASVFHGRIVPEPGTIVGYAAMIDAYNLAVPMSHTISLISTRNRRYRKNGWNVLTPKHQPEDILYKQLIFAIKYEGINLLFFKKLFEKTPEKEIIRMIKEEPSGQYSRKIWFLFEWLTTKKLNCEDADTKIKFTPLLDEKLQYGVKGENSARHRIVNNLPGVPDFCPLIWKTAKLEAYIAMNLSNHKTDLFKGIRKDILQRTAAFLLLEDSKASFTIEGESPKSKRAARWGKAIGQAGIKPLSLDEFIRLQQLIIENTRFVHMGFRKLGGFVGEHDRTTGEPIPDHISAKPQDLEKLLEGLVQTGELLEKSDMDAVLVASLIAFGFVFIHPFSDGNGRIHRYIIHHYLISKAVSQQGIIFPVSASILDNINDYRLTLETYSKPLLDFIDWKATSDHNVEVVNDTSDYYRYFDATILAEYLYSRVLDTIENIIPQEVRYLRNFDDFKSFIDDEFEMPDKSVALLIRFLEQNEGKLSKRAQDNEFKALTNKELKQIEQKFKEVFL